jgi:membrane-bound serine protease (ClpP class)
MFVLPGFGIAGLSGIALILASFILAMTGAKAVPGIPWWNQKQYEQAFYTVGLAIAGSVAMAFLALKLFLPRTPFWDKIALESAETKEKGFTITSFENFLGKEGESQTVLRPSGKDIFDEEILDVVAEGEMIPKDTRIKVIRVEGNRIVVAKND